MAATESTMLALGTPASAFRLADFNGKVSSLEDFAAARGLVVALICNHCPYVKHMRNELARFARDLLGRLDAADAARARVRLRETVAKPRPRSKQGLKRELLLW